MSWFFMQIVAFKTYYQYEKGLCVCLGDVCFAGTLFEEPRIYNY